MPLPTALEERLAALLDGSDKRPDAFALQRLAELHERSSRAAQYALDELQANWGDQPNGRGFWVEDFELCGADADGPVWRMKVGMRECHLRHEPARNLSKGLMNIVGRWAERLNCTDGRLMLHEAPARLTPPKRPRVGVDGVTDSPPGLRPGPPPQQTAYEYVLANRDEGVCFEVRFRLEAAGGNEWRWENVLASPQALERVKEVQAAYQADSPSPRELNRLCRDLGLPPLGFQGAREDFHETVFEVEASMEGGVRLLPPQPDGNSHAHRQFSRNGMTRSGGGRLLRVRLAPLAASEQRDEHAKGAHRRWLKGVLRDGLRVAGRHYVYFDHKDAEKPTCQLWFLAASYSKKTATAAPPGPPPPGPPPSHADGGHPGAAGPAPVATPPVQAGPAPVAAPPVQAGPALVAAPPVQRAPSGHADGGHVSAGRAREMLLDVHAPKLTVSKLAARLGLAFSPAVPLCELAATRARFSQPWRMLDLRGQGADAYLRLIRAEQRDADAAAGAPRHLTASREGLTLVLVDDVAGRMADGSDALDSGGKRRIMTDGDGLISLDLASQIPSIHSGRLRTDSTRREAGAGGGVDDGRAGRAPLWLQVRLWWRRFVAKGGLSLDATLPDGIVVLRDSMVKVNARDAAQAVKYTGRQARSAARPSQAFEVLRTSNTASVGRLSPQLVPILAHGGGETMVRLLLALQREQIDSLLELKNSAGVTDERTFRRLLKELVVRVSHSATCAPHPRIPCPTEPRSWSCG